MSADAWVFYALIAFAGVGMLVTYGVGFLHGRRQAVARLRRIQVMLGIRKVGP